MLFEAVTTMIIGPFGPPSMYSGCAWTLPTIVPSKFRSRARLAALPDVNAESIKRPSREGLLFFCVTLTCPLIRGTCEPNASTRIATVKIRRFIDPRSCFPALLLHQHTDCLSRVYGSTMPQQR